MIEQTYRGTWNPFTNENHFAEIETCVEEVCLSYIFFLIVLFGTIIIMLLTLILCNISEIFYWAPKAVPHPTMMVTPRIFYPILRWRSQDREVLLYYFCVFPLFFMYIIILLVYYVYHVYYVHYMLYFKIKERLKLICILCIICIMSV